VAFSLTSSNVYISSLLSTVDWLEHGFGTSSGKPVPQDEKAASLTQIHSTVIHRIGLPGEKQAEGDGMFTTQPDLWLSIRTADCIPILLVDPRCRVVAAVHAGWRGTLNQILLKTVAEMTKECHSAAKDLIAAIGPGISECCFEVGEEVWARFDSAFVSTKAGTGPVRPTEQTPTQEFLSAPSSVVRASSLKAAGKANINLKAANFQQLLKAGLSAGNIDIAEQCTVSNVGFHSYRRDKTDGRMTSAIKIRRGPV
jgi:polyphenol oxidase